MARPLGGSNRNSRFLLTKLKEMYGKDFEPIIKSAENAVRMQEIADDNLGGDDEFNQRKECVSAWEKVAQYVSPKLKAIEVTGEDGGPVITTVERVIVKTKN